MANTYIPPVITVEPHNGSFRLIATSHGRSSIAGERILRSEPWPKINFVHDAIDEAERDAAILRAYLAGCVAKKGQREPEPVVSLRDYWRE